MFFKIVGYKKDTITQSATFVFVVLFVLLLNVYRPQDLYRPVLNSRRRYTKTGVWCEQTNQSLE